MATIRLLVNGKSHTVDADPDSMLLYTLQDDLELRGPKFGCGLSQCGSCTVLLDGEPIRACFTPISEANGREIVTLEGLGTPDAPHAIQQAFIDEQAMQCGFCISGPVLYGKAYIDQNPNASLEEIREALSGLLCRCYAHPRMEKALLRYAEGVRG